MSMLRAQRQSRRSGPSRRRAIPSRDTIRNVAWLVVIALSIAAAATYLTYRVKADRAAQRDPTTLCLLHAPSAVANLVIIDETDPLARDDGDNFMGIVRTIASAMRRNDRLTIVPFDGALGRTPTPIFDICSPGSEHEIDEMQEGRGEVRREFRKRFLDPLDEQTQRLMSLRRSDRSPIAEQIERIVTNPGIAWKGEQRILTILTDGLQYTKVSPIYVDGKISLPPPTPGLLDGVTVRYYLLANAKRSDLQQRQVQAAWRDWFEAAGATVEMHAPGFVPRR